MDLKIGEYMNGANLSEMTRFRMSKSNILECDKTAIMTV